MSAAIGRWDDQQVTPTTGKNDNLYVLKAARAKSVSEFNEKRSAGAAEAAQVIPPSLRI